MNSKLLLWPDGPMIVRLLANRGIIADDVQESMIDTSPDPLGKQNVTFQMSAGAAFEILFSIMST